MVWFISSDPCGIFCALVTVLLVLYGYVTTLFVLIWPEYGLFSPHGAFFSGIIFLMLYSHSLVQFTDPGAIPDSWKIEDDSYALRHAVGMDSDAGIKNRNKDRGEEAMSPVRKPPLCAKCLTVKPKYAHHCSTCQKCIYRLDHHCPWVNNCVAYFNQKYFLQFLVYVLVGSVYSGVLVALRMTRCSRAPRIIAKGQICQMKGYEIVAVTVLCVECVLFGIFVCIMISDQLEAIFTDTPGIDALQGKKGRDLTRMEALRVVFGERFSYRWFFPVRISAKMHRDFQHMGRHLVREQFRALNHAVQSHIE